MAGYKLEQELLSARNGDRGAREKLIQEHKGFIAGVSSKICSRYLTWDNDDELSIALLAFNEAIDKYKPGEGLFHSFARTVIQRRLSDYYRKECRNREVLLPEGVDNEGQPALNEISRSRDLYQDDTGQAVFKDSIESFIETLACYDITLDDLVKVSPKHRDSREQLTNTARRLAGEPALMEYLKKNRRLPIHELAKISGKSRRFLEKGRKYIIAVALIIAEPEFYPLRSFAGLLSWEKRGVAASKGSEELC